MADRPLVSRPLVIGDVLVPVAVVDFVRVIDVLHLRSVYWKQSRFLRKRRSKSRGWKEVYH